MTDMVSSATCPELATISDDKLPRLLERLVAARDFFTGLNPGVLLQLFRSDCVLCRETTAIEVLRPWRWDLGPRIYAVFGFRFRRIRHQGCIDGGLSDKPQ
jgi:hypothetical protein